MSDAGRVILIFGATGTAGCGAVQACLDSPDVSGVRAVTRRSLGRCHDKLVEVRCSDFSDLTPIADQFAGVDCCLYCLGISSAKVRDEAKYREIHVTYPLSAARTLLTQSPDASFIYLSGAGTKRDSSMMWSRVKAEAEDRLSELGLARQFSVRPGIIVPLDPKRFSRRLLSPLVRVAPALGLTAVELGQAMLRLGLDKDIATDPATLENRDLRKLLTR